MIARSPCPIRRRRRCALALVPFAFFLLLLVPAPAPAQGGSALVALVTAEPASPSARAVRRELEVLGLDVIVLRPPAEGTLARLPLEQAARSVGAIAAVRLVPSGEGAEVWVADRVTGKTVIRRILVRPDAGGGDIAAIATGAVELLRASLMELHAPSPPPGEMAASGRVRALGLPSLTATPRKPPRLGLAVAAAVEPGARGLAPSGAAQLAVWVRIVRGLGARVFTTLTFAAADVAVPEGAVHVTAHLLGGEASYDLRGLDRRFIPVVGLGAAAAWLQAAGSTRAPYESHSSTTWLWGPYVRAGLGFAATPGLRIRADALALVVTTPTTVDVAGRAIGSWGQPTLLFSLGVESMLAF